MGSTVDAPAGAHFIQVDEESTVFFQREEFTPKLVDEIQPLIAAHYREIAHYQDIPLDPDYDVYYKIADAGQLRVFTARKQKSGALVGYCLYFVRSNPHYKTSIQAVQDILFLTPELRGLTLGPALIAYTEARLKEEGVQVAMQHVKAAHNFGKMLERNGWELVDLIYTKRLDR